MPTIPANDLTTFAAALFKSAGVPDDEAQTVAESLVESNLRGHDSHGVMRIVDYIKRLHIGDLQAGVELKVLTETAAMLVCDAQYGFGQVQAKRLIERLGDKARQQGVASGTMLKSGHVGRLGEWAELAAANGLAALIVVNDNGSLQCVAPPGGTEPTISTNPVAIGVPTADGPLVVDVSTSMVANGKIRVAHMAREQCPPGWLLDADGNPTTDPAVRIKDPKGTILPLGGEQGGYKGFGLGLLFDILVGGLSGGFCPPQENADACNNVLAVVWDPSRAAGTEHFTREAGKLIDCVRNVRRKPGVDRIRLPGDRSLEVKRERLETGIPLTQKRWDRLAELAGAHDVNVPAF